MAICQAIGDRPPRDSASEKDSEKRSGQRASDISIEDCRHIGPDRYNILIVKRAPILNVKRAPF